MNRRIHLLLTLLPLLVLRLQAVSAQDSDEQNLYFAPKLDVGMILSINPVHIGEDGGAKELTPKMRESHEYMPFMPVIFFDPGSPGIPQRYQTFYSTRETDTYTDSSAIGAIDDIDDFGRAKYMQILNVIGYRLSENPSARVVLEPGYSTEPGENAQVASERGSVVRDYLVNIWRIAPERIETLPPRRLCDSSDNTFAQQEARRVLVRTDSWEIAKPICFVRMEAEPSLLSIAATITPNISPERITSVELVASAGDRILTRYPFTGHPDSTFYRVQGVIPLLWTIETMPDQVSVQAVVTTNEGQMRSTKVVSVPVRVKSRMRGDACEYESEDHLDLPLFPYRDTALSPIHRVWLDAFAERLIARHGEAVRTMQLSVAPTPDYTELPGIPEDVLMSLTSPMEMIRNDLIAPLLDPNREIPMFVRTQEDDEEGSGDMHEMEMFRVWFGDEALEKFQQFREPNHEAFFEAVGMLDDSASNAAVWSARARSVRRYLESRLGTLPSDTSVDSLDEVSYGDVYDNMHASSPEDRFFARTVSVWLQSSASEFEMPTDHVLPAPPAEYAEPEHAEDGEVHAEEYEIEEYDESTED